MSWIDDLDEAAGPLGRAVRAFAPELPKGPDGLRVLLSRIEAHFEIAEPTDGEDRAFVEGAGAALGLLLIAHVGDGEHRERDGVHRIRLGRFGFFDPFGAMESIIDAEDPRDELVRVVRLAEAEAGGTGPVSRVVTSLSEALARREPPLAVREHFERYVRLSDETEIDLGRIVGATEDGTPAAVARSVDKLLGFLGNERTIVPWEEARSRLLPRLVSPDFTDNLPDGAKGRGELAIESLTPSLHLALLLGHEGRSRFVRQDEVDAWGTSFAEAAAIAKENLARRSDAARFARLDTEAGPLVIARSGDGLDSARLVLPTLHDVLSPELGSPFLASVPHRDTLLAAPTGPTTIVAALRERTRDDAARAPHRISDALFLVAPDGISDVRGF